MKLYIYVVSDNRTGHVSYFDWEKNLRNFKRGTTIEWKLCKPNR